MKKYGENAVKLTVARIFDDEKVHIARFAEARCQREQKQKWNKSEMDRLDEAIQNSHFM